MSTPKSSHKIVGFSTVWSDFVLGVRLPALAILVCALYNTKLYYDAGKAGPDARFGLTKGKLLELQRHKYGYVAVPRYSVLYEFTVDGVTYTSRRATTGSPYRDWMGLRYTDTITEAQYLQSIPILRIGEPCTVFYDKKAPAKHAAIAHDSNSWETALMLYAAFFPLLCAGMMKMQYQSWVRYFRVSKTRVGFPEWAHTTARHPKPPPSK